MVDEEIKLFLKENYCQKRSEFNKRIIFTSKKIYGLKSEQLRKKAKELSVNNDFLNIDRNFSYESEFIIANSMAYSKNSLETKLSFYKDFFKETDNWSIIDSTASTLKLKNEDYNNVLNFVKENYLSDYEFLSRFAYTLLFKFISEETINTIFSFINPNAKYYVLMVQAWLLATMYTKYPNIMYNYLIKLDSKSDLFKMTTQKINDSYRVSKSDKMKLKELK